MKLRNNQINIRPVYLNELSSVSKIDKECFKEYSYPFFSLRQFYDISPSTFLIAENKNREIIGYTIGIKVIATHKAWVLALAVKEEHRHNNVGRRLTESLIKLLSKYESTEIYLTVAPENIVAINLYKSIGFNILDIVDDYFGVDNKRIVMIKK